MQDESDSTIKMESDEAVLEVLAVDYSQTKEFYPHIDNQNH